MSQSARPVSAYRASLGRRLYNGFFRYWGGIGQGNFFLHRITGLGIAAFLVLHILDTFFVVSYPALYDHTVAIYGGVLAGQYYPWLRWGFRLGELGLIAAVLFHALNGLRIIAFDFWPRTCQIQKELAWAVLTVFVAIMIPISVVVCYPLLRESDHWKIPGPNTEVSRVVSAADSEPAR